jgi:glycosyltransferase involved in cell wall biosynthesis
LDYCHRHELANISLITGGVRTDYFCPDDDAVPDGILYIGKLNASKGLRETIAGYLRIAAKVDQPLHLVGRGIDRPHFESSGFFLSTKQRIQTRKLIEAGLIVLHGELSPLQIRSRLRCSRLLALPSQTEGFPIAILEALSCGVPVIASAVGSIPGVIKPGQNGYLIKPASILELAQSIPMVLKKCAEDWRESCRHSVEAYDMKNIASRYLELLNSVTRN